MIFEIREASIDDLEIIAKLHMLSWQQNYVALPQSYRDALKIEDLRKNWNKSFENQRLKERVWVAEHDKKPIGFCSAGMADKYIAGYPGYIDTIHILRDFTGQGLGIQLFNLCSSYLFSNLDLEGFYLFVAKEHGRAVKFYEKNGGTLLDLRYNSIFPREYMEPMISYGWKK